MMTKHVWSCWKNSCSDCCCAGPCLYDLVCVGRCLLYYLQRRRLGQPSTEQFLLLALSWLKPVRPGDTLTVDFEVVEIRRHTLVEVDRAGIDAIGQPGGGRCRGG